MQNLKKIYSTKNSWKKQSKKIVLLGCCCIFTLLLSQFLSLCSCSKHTNQRFTIVVTTSILGDAVKNIVQDNATVITLMGPGIDPHAYQATQKDVQQLIKADVIVYNGLHLEGKMAQMLQKLSKTRWIYAAGDAIAKSQLLVDPHFTSNVDPHIWFDVSLWKQVVQYLSEQLQAIDTATAAYYKQNTAHYLQKLTTLHEDTKSAMQKIPVSQRVLITAHDAFGYFGRAYKLEVVGLQGISTTAECGLRDVVQLVQFIIQRNIKAIFIETSVPAKPMQAVLQGCKQYGHQVVIGGCLYSDALGQAEKPEGTYEGMIRANVQTILNALK